MWRRLRVIASVVALVPASGLGILGPDAFLTPGFGAQESLDAPPAAEERGAGRELASKLRRATLALSAVTAERDELRAELRRVEPGGEGEAMATLPTRDPPPRSNLEAETHGYEETHGSVETHGSEPHNTDGPHEHEAPQHESIFTLNASDLDCRTFWILITAMLFFTIIVDRIQALCTWLATSRCDRMFLERAISELMMFGVVATSMFLISQFYHMPEEVHVLFEFVDILCSFAACFLILMGVILFYLRRLMETDMSTFMMEKEGTVRMVDDAGSMSDLSARDLRRVQWQVMRSQFVARHKLSLKKFSYNFYLIETLNQDICDLININWITWVVTFGVSLLYLGIRWLEVIKKSPTQVLVDYVLMTWVIWTGTVVIYGFIVFQVRQLYGKLGLNTLEDLRKSVKEAKEIEVALDAGKYPRATKLEDEDISKFTHWSSIASQCYQIAGLLLCFMLGFYVMHGIYNIEHYGFAWYWHLLFLFPLISGLFVILPHMLKEDSILQGFCNPNSDVMDAVVDLLRQAYADLAHVRTQLEVGAAAAERKDVKKWAIEQLKASSGKEDNLMGVKEFKKVLKAIGVVLSNDRARRLYRRLSHGSSTMTYDVFLEQVFNPQSEEIQTAQVAAGNMPP